MWPPRMNKQVQKTKNVNSKKSGDVKYQKNEQKSDSTHQLMVNNLEKCLQSESSSKKPCKEVFDKTSLVMTCFNHKPTSKDSTNINNDNVNNQLANKNVLDSSIDLSLPGLCSALQLASEIQLASTESKKLKQCNMPLQRNKKHQLKVVTKADIPFTKQIFKNLVDLHITDDDIVPGKGMKTKSASYDKKCDHAFILAHFYKPSFSTQRCSQIYNKKVDIDKVQFYNGLEMYNYTELFNSL